MSVFGHPITSGVQLAVKRGQPEVMIQPGAQLIDDVKYGIPS
jgi:hypothetical protein